VTTATTAWTVEDALDPLGLLNPGRVFRAAPAGDRAAVTGLVAEH
jgi:hypothetical protein